MTEQELRMMVREAIARVRNVAEPSHLAPSHPSHVLFVVPDGSDSGGPCIIEPAVMCNHCGYCKSLGH